jgi:hypothetical protein
MAAKLARATTSVESHPRVVLSLPGQLVGVVSAVPKILDPPESEAKILPFPCGLAAELC